MSVVSPNTRQISFGSGTSLQITIPSTTTIKDNSVDNEKKLLKLRQLALHSQQTQNNAIIGDTKDTIGSICDQNGKLIHHQSMNSSKRKRRTRFSDDHHSRNTFKHISHSRSRSRSHSKNRHHTKHQRRDRNEHRNNEMELKIETKIIEIASNIEQERYPISKISEKGDMIIDYLSDVSGVVVDVKQSPTAPSLESVSFSQNSHHSKCNNFRVQVEKEITDDDILTQKYGCPMFSLDADFEKINSIHEGTYGRVLHVKHIKSNVRYALKLITVNTRTSSSGFPKTALREIQILHTLNHENIVSMEGVAITNNFRKFCISLLMLFCD